MKTYIHSIFFFIISIYLLLTACDKNDVFQEIAQVSYQAPLTYWELPSSAANSGDSVLFRAQYYKLDKEIKNLQVWYSITENIQMAVSCPLVATFKYNININQSQEVRKDMRIATYPHDKTNWSDSLSCYLVNDKFPTSRTLRTLDWKSVKIFDQEKFDLLFPDTLISFFRKDLYSKMKVVDFRKVFLSTDKMTNEDFKELISFNLDPNSLDTIWFFKNESKNIVQEKFDEISFPELIYNSTDQEYKIDYSKFYTLHAVFKVEDIQGIMGISDTKDVELR